jgi:hypothetical protein
MRDSLYGIEGRPNHLKRDCTVRAMCIATGVDYIICATAIALCGRRNNCGARMTDWIRAYRKFGQCLTENQINLKYETIPNDNVIIVIRGHIFAIKNGVHSDGVHAFLNNNVRIRFAWRIV